MGIRSHAPQRATRAVLDVEMMAAAYSPDGQRRASRHQNVPVNLNYPAVGKTVGFEVLSRLDLAPGRYVVRMAAETSLHGVRVAPLAPAVGLVAPGEDTSPTSGSVYCDLDVPDFLNEPLALSGVALSVSPPVASGPARALASLVPLAPTTLREFDRNDIVGGFVRVSQGARQPLEPVTLSVRVVDGHGVTVHDQSERVSTDRFGSSRAADHQFDVPLSGLGPGPHLLTVSASAGTRVVSRDVRFTVIR